MTTTTQPFQRIWHGDSIELLKKVPDGKINTVITDPPFGVNNQSNSAVTPEGKANARKIANDADLEQAFNTFEAVWNQLQPKMAPESDIYIFTSHQVLQEWLAFTRILLEGGSTFTRTAIGVWEKDGPGMGDVSSKEWGMGMEFILYYRRGRRDATDKRRNFVLHYPQIRPDKIIHPHEKPTPLLETLIRHSTSEGDFIVDPFGGSASVAMAARNLNRSALCIELDELNFKTAKKRFEEIGSGMF